MLCEISQWKSKSEDTDSLQKTDVGNSDLLGIPAEEQAGSTLGEG